MGRALVALNALWDEVFREFVRTDPTCQKLRAGGMVWQEIDRRLRLAGLSRAFKREIGSTKELTLEELLWATGWIQKVQAADPEKLVAFVTNTAALLLPEKDPFQKAAGLRVPTGQGAE